MAEKEGWIKLYRAIQDNWLWKDKPFSKGQAWMDLLMECNHKANKIVINNQIISIQKGQKLWSIKEMSDRWGWSRKKVSNFLNLLQTEGMLQQKRTSKYTLLTIVNYDLYQDGEHQKNIRGTSKEHQKNTNKNEKNEKNEKNIKDMRKNGFDKFDKFDKFWQSYPKKRSKGQAEKAWEKIKPDEQLLDRILKSLERAKTSVDWKKEKGRYIPYPATWLNAKGWEDEYCQNEMQYRDEVTESGGRSDSGNSGEVDYDEFSL